MADSPDEAAKNAEKAYAAATEVKSSAPAKDAPPVVQPPAPKVSERVETTNAAALEKAAPKAVKRTAPKRLSPQAKAKAEKRAARVATAAAAPTTVKAIEPKPTVKELKDKIMAAGKNTDFTQPFADAFGEIQTRTKAAYEKSTEVVSEVTEFTKGNVEAFVESSKIFAAGAQALGKTYVDDAKSAYETATADVKEIAAVKSPTELFQLQGKILRRNFDAFVAASSKNTEAVLKLANESFAPLSDRVSLAAEKISKAA